MQILHKHYLKKQVNDKLNYKTFKWEYNRNKINQHDKMLICKAHSS